MSKQTKTKKMDLAKTITTEQEGILEQVRLDDIQDYLENIAEISNNHQDFLNKVAYGVTDETHGMSTDDNNTLEEWYFHNTLNR